VTPAPASGDYVIRKIGDGSQFDVLPAGKDIGYLRVQGAAVEPQTPIPTAFPATFSHPDIAPDEVTNRRKVLFSVIDEPGGGVAFAINNREFAPGRVDQSIELAVSENCVGSLIYTPAIRISTARVIRSLWSATLPVRRKLDRRTAAIRRVARIKGLPSCRISGFRCRTAG